MMKLLPDFHHCPGAPFGTGPAAGNLSPPKYPPFGGVEDTKATGFGFMAVMLANSAHFILPS